MTTQFTEMVQSDASDRSIFLSASIPDSNRWTGDYDPLEIIDATVALARACLTRGYRIVSAAHPTIAPLLFYVAAEFPRPKDPSVRIFQSQLFESVLPTITRRFEADGVGEIVWTEAVEGEEPVPGNWDGSLRQMRTEMLTDDTLLAAFFIGGMEGIPDELQLFREIHATAPTYPLGAPGGAARELADFAPASLKDLLMSGTTYPALVRTALDHLAATAADHG